MPLSARPTIEINANASPMLGGALAELTVIDDGIGPSRCEARFSNWGPVNEGAADYLFFDRRLLDFKAGFRVTLSDVNVFDGRIVAIDAGFPEAAVPTIAVRAEDRLVDLTRARRRRTFQDMSDHDIVSQIASEYRLRSNLAIPGPVHASVHQHNQTDLEFLRARMNVTRADLWVEGDIMHAQLRAQRDLGTITLIRGGELRELSVEDDPIARSYRVARGTCEANPGLRVGASVDLQGIGQLFSGRYRVSEVRHTFDHTYGGRTSFWAQRTRS